MIILRRRKLGRTSCREIAVASETGIRTIRNDKVGTDTFDGQNFIVRWGCTSDVPQGIPIINKAASIHKVNDKLEFRKVLDEHELCPTTWYNVDDLSSNELPVIVRKHTHAQGRHLHVCTSMEQVRTAANLYGQGRYYISEYINKVAELRVFVVQGRVACVANKIPADPDAVAWNVAKGGSFENVKWDNWNMRAVRYAVEAFNLSGLDFGGVDVMIDGDNNCYVLEINSAPSLTSPYRQSCMAKCFDYINTHGRDHIPMIKEKGGYRKYIHPAITDRAILVG